MLMPRMLPGLFMVGWALLLGELFTLSVYPVTFTVIIVLTNIYGVKAASRFNDALTFAKLGPLLFLICLGVTFTALNPSVAISHRDYLMTEPRKPSGF